MQAAAHDRPVVHPSMVLDREATTFQIGFADVVFRSPVVAEEQDEVFAVAERQNVITGTVGPRIGEVAVAQIVPHGVPFRQVLGAQDL